jgi:hypothetical protein
MKPVQWILISCRVLAVCFGLTLLNSGCGDQTPPPGGVTNEEAKRNEDTRKAMEENAQAVKAAKK